MADGGSMDFKQLHAMVGSHRIDGRASGESVSVVYNAEQFTENVGVDGEGYWGVSANLSARITITLMPSSDSNDVLFALWRRDVNTPGGSMFPFSFVDGNGRTVYGAAAARVVKLADGVWSDGSVVRSWTIATTRLEPLFVGGMNETPISEEA